MSEIEDIIRSEVGVILGDDSLVEYLAGLLAGAPTEEESFEDLSSFLQSAADPPLEEEDAAAATSKLFASLRAAGIGASDADRPAETSGASEGVRKVTALLKAKVVIGEKVETLAYGNEGDDGNYSASGTKLVRADCIFAVTKT